MSNVKYKSPIVILPHCWEQAIWKKASQISLQLQLPFKNPSSSVKCDFDTNPNFVYAISPFSSRAKFKLVLRAKALLNPVKRDFFTFGEGFASHFKSQEISYYNINGLVHTSPCRVCIYPVISNITTTPEFGWLEAHRCSATLRLHKAHYTVDPALQNTLLGLIPPVNQLLSEDFI